MSTLARLGLTLLVAVLPQQSMAETALEDFSGAIVGSGAVLGMGGAFIGIGEGADGHLFQPAAFTTRAWHKRRKRWDWDLASGSLSNQNSKSANEEADATMRRRFSQTGLNVKLDDAGFGVHLTKKDLTFKHQGSADAPEANMTRNGSALGFAKTQANGLWHWGVALEWRSLALVDREPLAQGGHAAGQTIFQSDSAHWIAGALWTPHQDPFRLGVQARGPIMSTEPKGEPGTLDIEFMPDALHYPIQAGFGASYQWGPRPFNELPIDSSPTRLTPAQRRHLLVAADLVITAPTRDSLAPRAYLKNKRLGVGSETSWSLRVGAESELIPDRLVVRGGSYYEPCRRLDCKGKWHGTAGMELHIRALLDLRLGVVVDVANDYQNAGLGVGIWH